MKGNVEEGIKWITEYTSFVSFYYFFFNKNFLLRVPLRKMDKGKTLKKYIFLLYSINEERTKEMCLLYLRRTYKEEVFITVKENVEGKSFES